MSKMEKIYAVLEGFPERAFFSRQVREMSGIDNPTAFLNMLVEKGKVHASPKILKERLYSFKKETVKDVYDSKLLDLKKKRCL